LLRLDAAAAEAFAGARLVRDGDLVAVLHADPEGAAAAFARLQAKWELSPLTPNTETISTHVGTPASQRTTTDRGDIAQRAPAPAKLFDATYRRATSRMPTSSRTLRWPTCVTARPRSGSTHDAVPTRDLIARSLDLSPGTSRNSTRPFVGGAFGGKNASAQAVEAARLSRIAGNPVQVAWTREEEFFLDTFDPAAVVRIASGLDRNARISFWDDLVYAAGERGSSLFYDVANARIKLVGRSSLGGEAGRVRVHPFATGPWRAPGANMNVFAVESQIDIMASAAGTDPVEFRLRHLSDTRMRRVLQAAADAFGWKAAAAPSGRGFGVACSIDAGTYVATMAEVKVDPSSGRVNVLRIACAQDMGIVVNPTGARMQIEGGA
jgi:isoquinoline 1-oxidoreductase